MAADLEGVENEAIETLSRPKSGLGSGMFRLFPGAQVDRPPSLKYAAALPFAELVLPSAPPRPATLAKWRETMPEAFQVALVVPKRMVVSASGPYRPSDELNKALKWIAAAQKATGAHVVLPSHGLTTSERDRGHLERVLATLGQCEAKLIFAPGGLWEVELAAPFCAKNGIICAYDPLTDDSPGGDVVYGRVAAIGARQRFSEGLLEDIVDALADSGGTTAYLAIESPRSFREAQNLVRVASGG